MTNDRFYELEKQIALTAVIRAAELCARVRADLVDLGPLEKEDHSPVTVADFGAQALACELLTGAFPGDVIVGEENSAALQMPENAAALAKITGYVRQFHPQVEAATVCRWIDAGNGAVSPRYWTLDPVDGTKGFLRHDQYAVALALVENGQVKVGALACPALPLNLDDPTGPKGVVFVAVRGQGAEMALLPGDHFHPIRVADNADPRRHRFLESVESAHGDHARQQAVARAAGISRPSIRMDSQVKYGVLARGDATLYLRLPSPQYPGYCENIWDHAAGSIIVEEAGGCVTDMRGQALDFGTDYKMRRNQGVVVSNGLFHRAVIESLGNLR